MANNPLLYNAALTGAIGGLNQRWLQSVSSGDYLGIRNAAITFATAVDLAIATTTPTPGQALILQCICQSVLANRFLKANESPTALAASIAVLYADMIAQLDPAGGFAQILNPGEQLGVPWTDATAGAARALSGRQQLTNLRANQSQSTNVAGLAQTLALNDSISINGVVKTAGADVQWAGWSSTLSKAGRILNYRHTSGGGSRSSFLNDAGGTDGFFTPDGTEFFCGSGTGLTAIQALLFYMDDSARWIIFPRGQGAFIQQSPLVIAVPAVAAGQVGYVDTTLVGTALEGRVSVNMPVVVQPQSDLVAAGAGGGFINARISAANTLRSAFLGPLAGGNANFTVTKIPRGH